MRSPSTNFSASEKFAVLPIDQATSLLLGPQSLLSFKIPSRSFLKMDGSIVLYRLFLETNDSLAPAAAENKSLFL